MFKIYVISKKKIFKLLLVLLLIGNFLSLTVYDNYPGDIEANEGEVLGTTSCETRAAWINPNAINDSTVRTNTINKLINGHFNTAFILAPAIGENYGWSNASAFADTVNRLHNEGFSVHAWVANAYRKGGGTYADFTSTTEQEAQKNWAMALLAAYPNLDGIHFDYIRYDVDGERLNSTKINGITATVAKTHTAIKASYPNKVLTAATKSLSQQCANFNLSYSQGGDDIPSWYRTWYAVHPDSATFNNRWDMSSCDGVPSSMGFQQDQVYWLNSSSIDFVVSMEYIYDTSWWSGEVNMWNSFFNSNPSKVIMGLGHYKSLWDGTGETQSQVISALLDKIEYGRDNNVKGFSIFEIGESGTNDSYLITALTGNSSAPFYNETTSCLAISSSTTTTPTTPTPIDTTDDNTQTTTIAECTSSNWVSSDSACQSNSKLTRTWTKIGTCENGVSHSSTESISCTYVAPTTDNSCQSSTNWSSSDGTCESDNFIKRTWNKTESCSGEIINTLIENVPCVYGDNSSDDNSNTDTNSDNENIDENPSLLEENTADEIVDTKEDNENSEINIFENKSVRYVIYTVAVFSTVGLIYLIVRIIKRKSKFIFKKNSS